jgi:hypothetical protein
MGEENENLFYSSRGTSRVLLHVVKSYVMVPPALLPIRKSGVLRILIALKNPSPWPGSNPQTLGPVTSTLTTTPPRRQYQCNINITVRTYPIIIVSALEYVSVHCILQLFQVFSCFSDVDSAPCVV